MKYGHYLLETELRELKKITDVPFFAEKKRVESHITRYHLGLADYLCYIKVITKLPNSEQSYKGKVKTHNYIKRQNQSTTGKL
jgi:hypothetical protein